MRELWPFLQRKLPGMFKGLEIKPSLLHGDLWSGNAAETKDGPGVCVCVCVCVCVWCACCMYMLYA